MTPIDNPTAAASDEVARRRSIAFLNWAHALDHFVLLIYPTVVIGLEVIYQRPLCRTDRAVDGGLCRLRRVLATGRLARRPLEPPQHDGGVLYRLRGIAGRHRGFAQSADACGRACSRSACSPPSITPSACRCCWKPRGRKGARLRSTGYAEILARRSPPASPPPSPPGSAGARPFWCRPWCVSPPALPMSCWCPTTATTPRAARRPPTWCSRSARR